jgi:hypothetical protein
VNDARPVLEELARRYREGGYEVVVEATVAGLPRVDLLATKPSEVRVVEVLPVARAMDAVARGAWLTWLDAAPGRHLDLVIGSRSPVEVTSASELATRIEASALLTKDGALESALMLSWAVFEAAARRRLLGEVGPGADALSSVAREGLVDPSEMASLRSIQRTRNAIAHGIFQPVTSAQVAALLAVARRLSDEEPPLPALAVGQ